MRKSSLILCALAIAVSLNACSPKEQIAEILPEELKTSTPSPTPNQSPEIISTLEGTPEPTPEPTPTPSPTPTPLPTPSPSPEPTPDIVITKHPNEDYGIIEGNTQISIARAENGELIHWQFTPPDYSVIYTDTELEQVFPVKVYKIDAETLWIVSIPLSMDGYKVRAVFANEHCEVYSDWANIHVIGFFTQIGHSYAFGSGVGAWATVVEINDDGSFTGFYHDWDAYGPGGIEGYQVECSFSGKFGRVGKIADHIYTMELLSFAQEGTEGDTYIDERGTTHVVTKPYGFENASLFYVYTPGIVISELKEEFHNWYNERSWPELYDMESGTYSCYGLYNYYGGFGFYGLDEN